MIIPLKVETPNILFERYLSLNPDMTVTKHMMSSITNYIFGYCEGAVKSPCILPDPIPDITHRSERENYANRLTTRIFDNYPHAKWCKTFALFMFYKITIALDAPKIEWDRFLSACMTLASKMYLDHGLHISIRHINEQLSSRYHISGTQLFNYELKVFKFFNYNLESAIRECFYMKERSNVFQELLC
jgi:hypothetical protein